MAQIPPKLLDPKVLGEDIYTCWRELGITDKIETLKTYPSWTALPADYRRAFVEAVQMSVTSAMKKVQATLDDEAALDFAFVGNEPEVLRQSNEKRECYICERTTLSASKIPVCSSCIGSYR